MKHPGQQIFCGQLSHRCDPLAEQSFHVGKGQLGQKIHAECQGAFFRGGCTGQFKHGRAADAELRKLHLATAGGHGSLPSAQSEVRIGPDAFQRLYIGVVRLDLHQSGVELRDTVAQSLKQLITAAGAAQLSTGHAAAADDHAVCRQGFLCGGDKKSFFAPFQAGYLEAGAGHDPGGVGGKTQHIQYAACLIGVGIDPAIVLRRGQQAQTVKEIQRGIQTQRFKGGADESGVLSVIVGKAHVQVGEVAAAVAGG